MALASCSFMKALQLLAVASVALLLGTGLTGVLEMPSSLAVPDELWWSEQRSAYPDLAAVGGPLEVVTVLVSLAVLAAALSRPHLLFLSAGSALCMVGAFSVWVLFTEPVALQMKHWLEGAPPLGWSNWRNQWEFSQLVRALLHLSALLLLGAGLLNVPMDERPEHHIAHG